jgi:biopolymer transport protein TolR
MSEVQSESGGRRKTIELNLVPFIDLMSVLITFLLITAVWTQVSMIQIGSSLYGKKGADQAPPLIPPDAEIVLRIDVKKTGYTIQLAKQVINLPLVRGEFDQAGLLAQMQKAKEVYPTKTDAVLQMADDLAYENLIIAMDALIKSGFPSISVATGGPN